MEPLVLLVGFRFRGGAGSPRPRCRHPALPGRFPFLDPRFFPWPTWAAEGRAPHASDDGITPTEMSPLFGHSPVANSPIITTCLGLRPALPRGRAERVPPRKPPPTLFPAFPRKAVPHRLTPLEGRAPHARGGTLALDQGICPLGHKAFICPR